MEYWQAEIKEKGNKNILKPQWSSDAYDHINDERIRECMIRKHLREFFGLDNPDVEWYVLYRLTK